MSHSFARSLNISLFTSTLIGLCPMAHAQATQPAPAAEAPTPPAPASAPEVNNQTASPVVNAGPSMGAEPAPNTAVNANTAAPNTAVNANTAAPNTAVNANTAVPVNATVANTAALGGSAPAIPEDAATPNAEDYAKRRQRGIDFYIGAGGSFATGKFSEDGDTRVSDASIGAVTGVVGLGYRISEYLYLGAYMEAGVGPVNESKVFDGCEDDRLDCSSAVVRYGLEGRYTFNPSAELAWWGGIGVGYDHFVASAKLEENDETVASVIADGSEVVLKAGVNMPAGDSRTMDVFISYSRGTFDEVSLVAGDMTGKVAKPGDHGWASVGVALVF